MSNQLFMRKLFTLLLFSLFIIDATAQTKKETINYLNTVFKRSAVIVKTFETETRFFKIMPEGNFEIKCFNYKPTSAPKPEDLQYTYAISGDLKDISPFSISTSNNNGLVYFYATCSNGKFIYQQNDDKRGNAKFPLPGVLLGVVSALPDPLVEANCKKALTRLILLCGGKE
jgi:hypothetical protein